MKSAIVGKEEKIQKVKLPISCQEVHTLNNKILFDSPPGSPIPGILQARVLEWGAIALLQCMKVKVKLLSSVGLFTTP